MTFETSYISRTGGRNVNQDSCDYVSNSTEGCWVVADGLGGHKGGEIASETATKAILETYDNTGEFPNQTLIQGLENAHGDIALKQEQDPELSTMQTTVVVLQIAGTEALWAHIGDTRLYYFSAGEIHFQTEDHSVPQLMVTAGDISADEIRSHEDRNKLLRSIGKGDKIKPTMPEFPRHVAAEDVFLLCTDGFWEYVTETEMEVDLTKSTSPVDWLKLMEKRVLSKVSGTYDNYSALAVFVNS